MRITIGSPIYERPEPAMMTCTIATLDLLRERGHVADWRYATSFVHFARNLLVRNMLLLEPDVIVQFDADMQWDPEDAVLAIEAVGEGAADVIGFAYLDRKPQHLNDFGWASPLVRDKARFGFEREGKHYIEVDGVGGGILCCSRSCMEKMSADAPRQELGDAPMVFDVRDGLLDDTFFCNRWRAMGGKVHCDITSLLGHIGIRVYAMDPSNKFTSLEFEDE